MRSKTYFDLKSTVISESTLYLLVLQNESILTNETLKYVLKVFVENRGAIFFAI